MVYFPSSSSSSFKSREFIEVRFEEKVYPVTLTVYEVFNASAVVRILSYCFEDDRWDVLWYGKPKVHAQLSQKCSPKLRIVNYMTNLFRVELHQDHLPYHYAIDAIKLTGSKTFIEESPGIEHICSKDDDDQLMFNDFDKTTFGTKDNENNICYLETLPREVLLLILSHLDIETLCATAKTSSFFQKLCYDTSLYRELDLQPYWPKVNVSTLEVLQERCTLIRRLNLSWCGSRESLFSSAFIRFLKNCCSHLTCLKLSNCGFVNDDSLGAIADFCPLLQVLELKNCRAVALSGSGFSQISRLKNLKYLDLYRTLIDQNSILSIVCSCQNLEHLFLGSCVGLDFDEVCREIARCLRYIKTLDFWKAKSLTGAGVNALASKCHNLVEVDLGWCREVDVSTNCIARLLSECRHLKKLFLTGIRTVSNHEIIAIADNCKELEQLDILGTYSITNLNSAVLLQRLLESCKNLRLLDLSFCGPEIQSLERYYRTQYSHVCIQFSSLSSEDF